MFKIFTAFNVENVYHVPDTYNFLFTMCEFYKLIASVSGTRYTIYYSVIMDNKNFIPISHICHIMCLSKLSGMFYVKLYEKFAFLDTLKREYHYVYSILLKIYKIYKFENSHLL